MRTVDRRPIYKSSAGAQAIADYYAEVLGRWVIPLEHHEVKTRWGRTAVLASGDASAATPLVLLHGAAANSLAWGGDLPLLRQERRVFALDIPGEPGRSDGVRAPRTGPAFAEWLADVLDGLGLAKVALAGVSFGAWAALKLATACPERVDKLVLISPGGVVHTRLDFILRAVLIPIGGKRAAAAVRRRIMGDKVLPEEVRTFLSLVGAHFNPWVGELPLLGDGELGRLQMPTLLVTGERDAVFSAAKTVERIRRLLPRATTELLAGEGHVLTDLGPRIARFLAEERGALPDA